MNALKRWEDLNKDSQSYKGYVLTTVERHCGIGGTVWSITVKRPVTETRIDTVNEESYRDALEKAKVIVDELVLEDTFKQLANMGAIK